MICDRCGKQTGFSTGSYFNTDQICMECDEAERNHPDFEKARDAELKEVQRGNFGYRGIGLPADLRR